MIPSEPSKSHTTPSALGYYLPVGIILQQLYLLSKGQLFVPHSSPAAQSLSSLHGPSFSLHLWSALHPK